MRAQYHASQQNSPIQMMTQDGGQAGGWPQDMQDDHIIAGVGDDDFTKFLDLDGNDFSQFSNMVQTSSGLDTPMGRLAFGSGTELNFDAHDQMDMSMAPNNDNIDYRQSMHQSPAYSQFQQYPQMQMQPHYHIPPTPVSADMQAAKYVQHVGNNGQILFDQQQVSFTPLVSPAQTPMDGGFVMSDYGLADDFFSPLTSPAIEAQAAYTGATASPVDLNLDLGNPKPTSAGQKRPRRKASNITRNTPRSVKPSPAMKPQLRRRQPSLSSITLDRLGPVLGQAPYGSNILSMGSGSATFPVSDESVSPEALSESAMRPPPIPHPARSPRPPALNQKSSGGNAVTPATLMRMPSDQALSSKALEQPVLPKEGEELMDDMMLPAAVSVAPPVLATIDTSKAGDDSESTPTMSAKSAKLTASSTPRSALIRSESMEKFAKPGKVDGRGGRASKKRPTTSNATISPALRPKISPSISPLVPASGPGMQHISPDASALYLASKSNYQNILEGTHLPGVSYPETLAENLTSKRTSHKIAEQGRRNRINLALKEIEALLPASILGLNGKKDRASSHENEDIEAKTEDSASAAASAQAQGASKASTVEMAIVYIRNLQSELAETKDKLEAAERRIAEGTSSAESQASE